MEPTEGSGDDNDQIPTAEYCERFMAAGRWARALSVLGSIIATAVFLSIIVAERVTSGALLFTDPAPQSGYMIQKKYFVDVDVVGYLFLFGIYVYWLAMFYVLFRFSGAAVGASHLRSSANITRAMGSLTLFFKLLVIGAGLLILLVLTSLLAAF